MSGISYMNNTETASHEPPYFNEYYHMLQEYANQREEDLSFFEAQAEESQEGTYPEEYNEEPQQEQENFMNAEPTSYPT